MVNKVLGKGLSALISDKPKTTASKQALNIEYVDVSKIKVSSYQPRENFSENQLSELAASIKEKGILQPLILRQTNQGYELIAGERRLRAARILKIEQVPAIIRDADNKDSLTLSIIENVQRQQLNPIEEAHAFKRLISEFGISQEEVGKAVGKDRSSISNTLRLLNLPKEIQDEVNRDRISMGHARALLSLADTRDQMEFFEKVLKNSLSVRELEKLIQESPKQKKTTHSGGVKRGAKDPHVVGVEEQLQHRIGSKVKINVNRKNKGTIVIEFYSLEDFDRIIAILKK